MSNVASNSSGSASLQLQAIQNARAAFSKLPRENATFEKCVGQAQTIPEILEVISKRHLRYKRKKFTRLSEKFQNHTLWLQNISGVVDVVVQMNAGIACPLWAPIKFVLIIANDQYRAAEKILEVIQIVSENLPRFDVYQKLKSDPHLQASLINVFTDIVEFAMLAYRYFRRKALDEKMRRMQEYETWLRPPNVKNVLDGHLLSRVDGTCQWIWDNDVFRQWMNISGAGSSRLLCVHGPHGCGKSILASSIAHGLEERNFKVLYFSFSDLDSGRQKLDGLIKSLLWRFLIKAANEEGLEIFHQLKMKGPPSTSDLWRTFEEISTAYKDRFFCIIDGVDECPEWKIVLSYILSYVQNHENVAMALIGRLHPIQEAASSTPFVIEITPKTVEGDIIKFVNSRIGNSPIIDATNMRESVHDVVTKQSSGMFLWVQLMMDDISEAATATVLKCRLQNLPNGLENAYRRILHRLTVNLDDYHIRLLQKVLAYIIVACRTLSVDELNYIIALDSRNTAENDLSNHLLHFPQKSFLQACGDFITISNGLVQLIHFSVKEFLTRPECEWLDEKITRFRVSEPAIHTSLSHICLDYISISRYFLPLSDPDMCTTAENRQPLLNYAALYTISHIKRIGAPDLDIRKKLLRFFGKEKFIMWIEYVGVYLLQNESLEASLEEVKQLQNLYGGELIDNIRTRFLAELERRIRSFGDQDARTVQ